MQTSNIIQICLVIICLLSVAAGLTTAAYFGEVEEQKKIAKNEESIAIIYLCSFGMVRGVDWGPQVSWVRLYENNVVKTRSEVRWRCAQRPFSEEQYKMVRIIGYSTTTGYSVGHDEKDWMRPIADLVREELVEGKTFTVEDLPQYHARIASGTYLPR